jgi:Fe-Mn family superoxide dismutase
MFYQLPELPYPENALEPYIDAETMRIHHGKHHATYVENLNEALSDHPQLQGRPLEVLLSRIEAVPESIRQSIRNNGGGHYNHSLFWKIMKKDGGGSPQGELADAIKSAFGTYTEFKSRFSQAALKQFGSGWAWLTWRDGRLHVESMPNQDNPIMTGGEPVLGLDIWEHAYYLHYKNRRADYVEAWWNVVNWIQVAENFNNVRKGARIFGFPVNEHELETRKSRARAA